uniref:Uncharacterized protein n=1 Tax=Setaria digitata TaxID=48799 RepID=A0A915PIE2_9BILA
MGQIGWNDSELGRRVGEQSAGRVVRIVCLLTGERDGLHVSDRGGAPTVRQTLSTSSHLKRTIGIVIDLKGMKQLLRTGVRLLEIKARDTEDDGYHHTTDLLDARSS